MRRLILIIAGFSTCVTAYERSSMPNLMTPSELEAKQMMVSVYHRFLGPVDEEPLKTFLGMDQGISQVVLGLRFNLGKGFELKALRKIKFPKDFTLGLSYGRAVPGLPLKAQLDFQTISILKQSNSDDRESDWFGLLSLQTNPLMRRVTPVLNIGYDHRYEYTGAGIGLSLEVFKWLHLQSEYGLTSYDDEGPTNKSVSIGIKLLTYGHHFLLFAGNNQAAGPLSMLRGARPVIINGRESNKLYFGFNILRIFEF
jgi:hypothetical protein